MPFMPCHQSQGLLLPGGTLFGRQSSGGSLCLCSDPAADSAPWIAKIENPRLKAVFDMAINHIHSPTIHHFCEVHIFGTLVLQFHRCHVARGLPPADHRLRGHEQSADGAQGIHQGSTRDTGGSERSEHHCVLYGKKTMITSTVLPPFMWCRFSVDHHRSMITHEFMS